MASHVFKYDAKCEDCKGTGLYRGMAERDGVAVVCCDCKGTGRVKKKIKYDDPEPLVKVPDIHTVIECNPGIVVGDNMDFGGMLYEDWFDRLPFPIKSEMRFYSCPNWWYQIADGSKMPNWDCCTGSGKQFSQCKMFKSKSLCWKRWDKEHSEKVEPVAVGQDTALMPVAELSTLMERVKEHCDRTPEVDQWLQNCSAIIEKYKLIETSS